MTGPVARHNSIGPWGGVLDRWQPRECAHIMYIVGRDEDRATLDSCNGNTLPEDRDALNEVSSPKAESKKLQLVQGTHILVPNYSRIIQSSSDVSRVNL